MTETLISLSGGALHLTEQPDAVYRVESGSALVYLIPIKENGRPGRRMLIYEAKQGEIIPAFCCDAPSGLQQSDENCPWRFGFTALDKTEIVLLDQKADEQLQKDFLSRANLRGWKFLDYEECVLETYWLNIARELRNIYKTGEEQEASYRRGLHIIYNMFRKKGERAATAEPTGNVLYDAVRTLCEHMNISAASLEDVQTSCGKKFSVNDIARVSHFTCRDVVLDEGWFRRDSGPLLVFVGKNNLPMACVPKGPSKYMLIDPADGSYQKVDEKLAAEINPQAYMFYRPLPNKKLGV